MPHPQCPNIGRLVVAFVEDELWSEVIWRAAHGMGPRMHLGLPADGHEEGYSFREAHVDYSQVACIRGERLATRGA